MTVRGLIKSLSKYPGKARVMTIFEAGGNVWGQNPEVRYSQILAPLGEDKTPFVNRVTNGGVLRVPLPRVSGEPGGRRDVVVVI